MNYSFSIRENLSVDCADGDKPFRSWRRRHGRAVREFRAVPRRDGGWTIKLYVPQDSAILTVAAAELLVLRRDYCLPDYTAPTAEYLRQRAARDSRRADGYDVEADPVTVAGAAELMDRQAAQFNRRRA